MSYKKSSRAVKNACFTDIIYEKPEKPRGHNSSKNEFLDKLFFKFFFYLLKINPDARSDSSIIFRFSIILHQNYREYIRENRKRGITL